MTKTAGKSKKDVGTSCGFFGPNNLIVKETELRGKNSTIHPNTLAALQANAVDPVDYGDLLVKCARNSDLSIVVTEVRAVLMNGVDDAHIPADLNDRVEEALCKANNSRCEDAKWSAVFITACVRNRAITLGLETLVYDSHIGSNKLLIATAEHRKYVREAHDNRFGSSSINGTYHAFHPAESFPQVGDMIIQDREANEIGEVIKFEDIPTVLEEFRNLHGDIVTEVSETGGFVVAIGGNIGKSARRRRYPLDNNCLVVEREQLYTQEDDNGELPYVPAKTSCTGLESNSTGRIFALLSPVPECKPITAG